MQPFAVRRCRPAIIFGFSTPRYSLQSCEEETVRPPFVQPIPRNCVGCWSMRFGRHRDGLAAHQLSSKFFQVVGRLSIQGLKTATRAATYSFVSRETTVRP